MGGLNLGGSFEPIHNAISIAEHAIEKGATKLLAPISTRKQLIDLPDDAATKISIEFYKDSRDCLLKALKE